MEPLASSSSSKANANAEIQEGKFFAICGYLFILCFVPLILKKDNKFAQFHGRQGLILFIIEVAAAVMKSVPVIGDVIFSFAYVILAIASLLGIVRVLMNEYWPMPLVHNIAEKITL